MAYAVVHFSLRILTTRGVAPVVLAVQLHIVCQVTKSAERSANAAAAQVLMVSHAYSWVRISKSLPLKVLKTLGYV